MSNALTCFVVRWNAKVSLVIARETVGYDDTVFLRSGHSGIVIPLRHFVCSIDPIYSARSHFLLCLIKNNVFIQMR